MQFLVELILVYICHSLVAVAAASGSACSGNMATGTKTCGSGEVSLADCESTYIEVAAGTYGQCGNTDGNCLTKSYCTALGSKTIEWSNLNHCSAGSNGGLGQTGGGWGSSWADAEIPAGTSCIEWQVQNTASEVMVGFKCGGYSARDVIYKNEACSFYIYKHQNGKCKYKAQGTGAEVDCGITVDWSSAILKVCRQADNKFKYYHNGNEFHTSAQAAKDPDTLDFHASFGATSLGKGEIVKADATAS